MADRIQTIGPRYPGQGPARDRFGEKVTSAISSGIDTIKETGDIYKRRGLNDAALNVGDRLRYGVGLEEKEKLEMSPMPGKPSYATDQAGATRYISNLLGAKKWGQLPADVLNSISIDDLIRLLGGNAKEAWRLKALGAQGAAKGAGVPGADPSSQPIVTAPVTLGRARR